MSMKFKEAVKVAVGLYTEAILTEMLGGNAPHTQSTSINSFSETFTVKCSLNSR